MSIPLSILNNFNLSDDEKKKFIEDQNLWEKMDGILLVELIQKIKNKNKLDDGLVNRSK